jgi:UBX domain-containing protein 1/4
MKSTKESQDRIEQLKVQERLKEAAQKRREKKEEEDARKRVLAQIQRDKEARKQKAEAEKRAREGGAIYVEPSVPTPAQPAAPAKKAADYTDTRLRLQTPNGTVQKNFPVETTLFEVAHALAAENGTQASTFTQNFPRKTFDNTDFGMTLKEAGLVPSAALIVR